MKIAVTYDNGEIFQHFGKTESFKVYEVEDNKVVSSEVIGSNGTGHGALAGLLAEQGVNVLRQLSQKQESNYAPGPREIPTRQLKAI